MMKCKFYSEEVGTCLFDGPSDVCPFENNEGSCTYLKPKMLKCGSIALPKYSARISIGSLQINLTDKTFTEEQIKNMKEILGWEVENL